MSVRNKAAARVQDAVDPAVDAAPHGETLSAAGEELMVRTCKYVAAHPLQSLGLALAAGYLIGRLTR